MAQDQVANAPFGIAVPAMILLVPTRLSKSVINICEYVVLNTMVPRNLVGSDSIEKLALFANCEPVQIHPRTVYPSECSVKVFLAVLGALQECHIW
jgi:hypothetical protein